MSTLDLTVVIGTYGDETWEYMARTEAMPSAEAECEEVILVHGDTLAQARNAGAKAAQTEWIVYLDADDQLEPGFREAIAAGEGDVRVPAYRQCNPARNPQFVVPRICDLRTENFVIIGSVHRRSLALEIGGFLEWPVNEDWCYWQRCWKAGAEFVVHSGAVYRTNARMGSRNRSMDLKEWNDWHRAILRHNFPDYDPKEAA
jgi:glycosyltransferase involved in cell wall biosynthesis